LLAATGTVTWHDNVNAPDRNVPFIVVAPCGSDTGLSWAAPHARLRQAVSAVAGLGDRVGAEARAGAQIDELDDDVRVLPLVDVIDELGPLVTDVSGVLEAERALHGGQRSI